ncbi:ATP-dependent nuclease [Dyadobacter sp. MSC1_007]|uniref:ATP-dependent nuclease n=1 Tax=Dyadobacter sp. MSC1_007 TaxID=2909264 RepID=UPI00202F03D4|nr:AAA family ATPase [Dyadobacter sp. MSC1_007]
MLIKSIYIKKFRGFLELSFTLGKHMTVIAGQNGTQKTTLLGILSQPFTITDKDNPLFGEKPLCGGNYKSLFSEKFKLSDAFDIPQGHEWTLRLDNDLEPEFTIESIRRDASKPGIRFWKKGDRSKGSGYIQLPVVYLSLSRLFPIGEDLSIDSSNEIILSELEFNFYQEWHNKILLIPDVEMTAVDYLASKQKNTLGANTSFYDWKMNSAGQDNIGKILLAILSFRRLQEKYKGAYKGGILAIDELDATLYPASQIKLIEALRVFSRYRIQIIFTTHSLPILEKACGLQADEKIKGQVRVVYLQKIDSKVAVIEDVAYEAIKNRLNVALSLNPRSAKIPVFSEDEETQIFCRALIKRRSTDLAYLDCTLGCENLLELARKQIVGFRFPDSLVVLDGDVRGFAGKMRSIAQHENFLILPGEKSPERLIADFLHSLSDNSEIWKTINPDYSKQFVFKDYSFQEIGTDRQKAKNWFRLQKEHWGKNCVKVINPWMKQNSDSVDSFLKDFDEAILKFRKTLL